MPNAAAATLRAVLDAALSARITPAGSLPDNAYPSDLAR